MTGSRSTGQVPEPACPGAITGTEATLAAGSARPDAKVPTPSGTERTLAVGSVNPLSSADTVAQGPARARSARGTAPAVRAGSPDDYPTLVEVERRHFVIGQEIARGGMGRIIAARDRRLGRSVAIKELLTSSDELRTRFEREARITAKLQHPAIVSVLEAGTWPTGEPFYVMKQVIGDSLAKVIAERPALEQRMALLPHAIAVVDALAYAHRQGVIHRDLKPANVLVGEFGETVVIDWGLAKELSDPAQSSRSVSIPSGSAELTTAGDVMGTPAYMPLEQAEGDPVDARSDVYALGAILYHMLAGVPPYEGRTAVAVLAAVREGPPPPLLDRVPAVPRELTTIVSKAMARRPEDRYADAKGLAEDLKRFQTGQLVGAHAYSAWQLLRRWIRRHRAPLAVAAAAIVVLAGLGVVSVQRVVHERQLAERSRGDAEGLVGFMLGDLRERLDGVGRLDLLDSVAKKALAYYASRGDALAPDEERERAMARSNLADVLLAAGSGAAALDEYRAALDATDRLARDQPSDANRRGVADHHMKLGSALGKLGNTQGALDELHAALAIRDRTATDHRDDSVLQGELADTHFAIGDELRQKGDPAAALAELQLALGLRESVVAQAKQNGKPNAQRDVAATEDAIGLLRIRQGKVAEALVAFRNAAASYEAVVAADPKNAEYKRDLAVSYQRVGNATLQQGDARAARDAYARSSAIFEALAASDPSNAAWQRDLWTAHLKAGDLIAQTSEPNQALGDYRAALDIAVRLAAKDPTNQNAGRDLAISYDKVGPLLAATGDAAGALVDYNAARAIEEAALQRDPHDVDARWQLVINHNYVGDLAEDHRDHATAQREYEQAIELADKLATEDPANADKQQLLAASHGSLATVLAARRDFADAIAHDRSSLAIEQRLAERDASDARAQLQLIEGHSDLADVLGASGDRAAARAELETGLDVARRLVAAQPDAPGVKDTMHGLETKLAKVGARDRAGVSRRP
jgi:tetratricopeptide (TPR) repeat protein/tRNA A-37 threonylcarbamoyl transferase component Bud32